MVILNKNKQKKIFSSKGRFGPEPALLMNSGRYVARNVFSYVWLYKIVLCVCVCMGVTPPDQTKNDRDLKFGTHTPLDHI